ncbi:hypothetical protein AVEN_235186-1 [Araneus ventricosus]|uniref:Uncharacterized protein n=1 Tax=Araneus ventricosus TaxID=182803 RepID=A0A4Y2LXR6_ARAVE|nr:hypothetical protein AVEN_235186-1 [Araneus ventricosus]
MRKTDENWSVVELKVGYPPLHLECRAINQLRQGIRVCREEDLWCVVRRGNWRRRKPDILGHFTPRKWRGSTSHHSNFQPTHLVGPFTEAPCKPHHRSLRSPRANVTPPPLA